MKILRLKQVMETTGLARSTIYKFIADGGFPQSISLGGRSVGWVEEEVHGWIKDKIVERGLVS